MKLMNYAGITMLAAAPLIFAACSSDTEVTNDFADVTGETVKSQFSIALPSNKIKNGRMTAGEGQEEGDFLGMQRIFLFPLTEGLAVGDATPTTLKSHIELSNIDALTTNHVKVYNDVQIPLGTNAFLFYGRSIPATGNENETGLTAYWDETTLQTNVRTTDLYFKPVTCHVNNTATEAAAGKVLAALNDVATTLKAANDAMDASQNVKDLYAAYITNTAGSSTSVLAMMEDLYNALMNEPVSTEVTAAINAIKAKFTVTTGGSANNYELSWTEDPKYPNVAGIPDGGVSVKCTNNVFAYTNDAIEEGIQQTQLDRFVKPASLYYFVNTPAGVDENTHFGTGEDFENSPWATVTGNGTPYEFNSMVDGTTKSVILKDPVQYGVAQLVTSVSVSNTPVKDNKGYTVQIPSTGYRVTGVLVGDQKEVNWNFTPNTSADDMTLYDGKMTNENMVAKVGETNPIVNFTNVLETEEGYGNSLKVAIELVNDGEDFYGIGGKLIPAGTKFYLVGSLTVPNESENPVTKSVFKQDFRTVAKFTITSLKNAYNVVPDLRSPKMEFALSVDLDWKNGLIFNVDLQ